MATPSTEITWRVAIEEKALGMNGQDFQLGIDFGTSHTVAMLRWPDVPPILFEGSPLLPIGGVRVERRAAGRRRRRTAPRAVRARPAGAQPQTAHRRGPSTAGPAR